MSPTCPACRAVADLEMDRNQIHVIGIIGGITLAGGKSLVATIESIVKAFCNDHAEMILDALSTARTMLSL